MRDASARGGGASFGARPSPAASGASPAPTGGTRWFPVLVFVKSWRLFKALREPGGGKTGCPHHRAWQPGEMKRVLSRSLPSALLTTCKYLLRLNFFVSSVEMMARDSPSPEIFAGIPKYLLLSHPTRSPPTSFQGCREGRHLSRCPLLNAGAQRVTGPVVGFCSDGSRGDGDAGCLLGPGPRSTRKGGGNREAEGLALG